MELYKDSDFTSITTKTLVATYNDLTGKNIKKFASRAKGIEQLRDLLPEAPKKKKGRGRTITPFNYPFDKERFRAPREESFRGKVVKMLSKAPGKKLEKVIDTHKAFHKSKDKPLWEDDHYRSEARALLQFLHYDHGYGIREDEKGNIMVFAETKD